MATPLPNEKAIQVHKILYNACHDYIPTQELTHAANEICKEPTLEKCNEMIRYLFQFDKEFVPLQTVDTKAITNNQIRYAMAEVVKFIQEG